MITNIYSLNQKDYIMKKNFVASVIFLTTSLSLNSVTVWNFSEKRISFSTETEIRIVGGGVIEPNDNYSRVCDPKDTHKYLIQIYLRDSTRLYVEYKFEGLSHQAEITLNKNGTFVIKDLSPQITIRAAAFGSFSDEKITINEKGQYTYEYIKAQNTQNTVSEAAKLKLEAAKLHKRPVEYINIEYDFIHAR